MGPDAEIELSKLEKKNRMNVDIQLITSPNVEISAKL